MIETLYGFFGVPGILAGLAWTLAVGLAAAGWRRARRERWLLAALGCAAAGWLAAGWCGERALEFGLDRTDEIREAEEARRRLLGTPAGEKPALRFAEDAPGEAAPETTAPAPAVAAPDAPAAGPDEPAYRAGGKKRRAAGKTDEATAALAERAGIDGESEEGPRLLKLADYRLLNRLDRLGALGAKVLFLALAGLLAADFLRRFNRPFDSFWPVPISGKWALQVSPPQWVVTWEGATEAEVRRFLERAVRKGHAVLYFGDRAGGADLRRLRLGRWGFWPLPRLAWGAARVPRDPEFALDAVWFGRYMVSVGPDEAAAVLEGVAEALARRQRTRAWAARLPHLVWDVRQPPPPAVRARLADACRETGVRWVEVR